MYSQNVGQPYDHDASGHCELRKEKNVKEKNRSERKQAAISRMKTLVPGMLPNTSKKQAYIQTQKFLEYLEKETARRNLLVGEALVSSSKNDVPLPENDVEFIKAMEKKFLDLYAGQPAPTAEVGPIRKPYVRRGNASRQRGPYKGNSPQWTATVTAASTSVQPQIPQDVYPSYPMGSSFPSGYMVPNGTNFLPYPQGMQQYEQPVQNYNPQEYPMPVENFCPQNYVQPVVDNFATQEYGMPVQNFQPYLY